MSRAVGVAVIGVAVALAGCSGGGSNAAKLLASPVCPLLGQLAQTGETVANANVSDPAAFNTTLRTAVTSYVHTAKSLRKVVPPRLRDDVDSMITAAQQHHFSDAAAARNAIDDYAQTVCKTT